jgi:parvulin-like peptidyl-prolyl isomerase
MVRGWVLAKTMPCCVALGLCVVSGCQPSASAPSPKPVLAASDIVAQVGDAVISREALQSEWQRRGGAVSKSAILEEMIRFEAALVKARAAGYDRRPEVTNRFNQLIVARYQEDRLNQIEGVSGVSQEELTAYYSRHAARFAVPEQARAAVIVWQSSAKADPERRQELSRRAQALAVHARHADADAFVQLVQAHSEDQSTRYRGGDAGWLVRAATNGYWEPAVIEAVFALKQPGETSDVVTTSQGLYVARLLEHRAASVRPIEEVKELIEYEVAREKRARLEKDQFDELKAGLRIQVNQSVLDSIQPAKPLSEDKPPALPKG